MAMLGTLDLAFFNKETPSANMIFCALQQARRTARLHVE